MSKNKKQPKQRNYLVKQMILRRQNAGYHKDKNKEAEKYSCRGNLTEDLLEELEDDFDLDYEE